jgi:hypothetical protein
LILAAFGIGLTPWSVPARAHFSLLEKPGKAAYWTNLAFATVVEACRGRALNSRGTHEATFAIDDVTISPKTAVGRYRKRRKGARRHFPLSQRTRIRADWSGQKTMSAWTDIYIHDATQRERILAAFQAL